MQTILVEGNRAIDPSKESPAQPRMSFLGVRADRIDGATALNSLRTFAMRGGDRSPAHVFFTNVHSIHLARRDQDFMRLINSADLALPDGAGLKIAGKLFGTPIMENLNGTDLTPRFLKIAELEGLTVYLLGGLPEVVEGCYCWLSKEYPKLRIVGFRHGHFLPEEEDAIIEEINAARPHVLLVALGSPRQERWIARNSQHLKAGVCMGVGGLFDFLSGSKSRAPQWMRRMGIEWVYRFIQDPKTKWDRVFIEIPTFLALIAAKQLISGHLRTLLIRKNDAS
jgi:N-acetylglucosaminyldiphosphoundecaprenol N-acetyl-beta-D-mannosaminyltransferase